MTKLKLALAAAVTLAAITAFLPALAKPAVAAEYPWCAHYSGEDGGGRNCGFVSYDQCMLTIRGMGGFCEQNQFYPSAATKQPLAKRKRQSAPD
jgi:hypothetical protein